MNNQSVITTKIVSVIKEGRCQISRHRGQNITGRFVETDSFERRSGSGEKSYIQARYWP